MPIVNRTSRCGHWQTGIYYNKLFASAVNSVLDMVEGEEVAVIGTLYKEMKLKPSILSEYTKVIHPTATRSFSSAAESAVAWVAAIPTSEKAPCRTVAWSS